VRVWTRQEVPQAAIGAKKHETSGVAVEAAVEAQCGVALRGGQDVENAALGRRCTRAHRAHRFVEEQETIKHAGRVNDNAVNAHLLGVQQHLVASIEDDHTRDADTPSAYQEARLFHRTLLRTPRPSRGLGEEMLEAHLSISTSFVDTAVLASIYGRDDAERPSIKFKIV
jgi:hypothetical protein